MGEGAYTVHSDCPPPCSLAKPQLNKRQVHPNNICWPHLGWLIFRQNAKKWRHKKGPLQPPSHISCSSVFPRPPAAPSSGRAVKRRFCFGDARMYCRSCTWLRRCLLPGFRGRLYWAPGRRHWHGHGDVYLQDLLFWAPKTANRYTGYTL